MSQQNYMPISQNELRMRMEAILDNWKSFYTEMVKAYNEKNATVIEAKYDVNIMALREVVERVYQRDDYFRRYHSNMAMSEYKEIGLNMFWLIKFKPFNVNGKGFVEEFAFDINELFAVHYMFCALNKLAQIQGKVYDATTITEDLYNELLYSLSFRDVSKEALGVIVELMAKIVINECKYCTEK